VKSRALRLVDGASSAADRSGTQQDAAEPLQTVADRVAAELKAALALRRVGADPKEGPAPSAALDRRTAGRVAK
jgi:hypothetical protein